MSIYTIGDLHLSFGCEKPMDIFKGWTNYVEKIEENWRKQITTTDTVVLCGDISWGMSLEESLEDFKFIDALPGQKLILKGNHDYWWTTVNKMESYFSLNNLNTLHIIHNNSYIVGNVAICGSRGWLFEKGEPHDIKILNREAIRLQSSLQSVKDVNLEKIVFLHYPPVYAENISEPIINVILENNVKRCFYGHIHGAGHRYAIDGVYLGVDFQLVSADYIRFNPVKVV